ncbi:MAG: hypothetical protein VW771_11605, partial [Gammaproteobacteria bacterium]
MAKPALFPSVKALSFQQIRRLSRMKIDRKTLLKVSALAAAIVALTVGHVAASGLPNSVEQVLRSGALSPDNLSVVMRRVGSKKSEIH